MSSNYGKKKNKSQKKGSSAPKHVPGQHDKQVLKWKNIFSWPFLPTLNSLSITQDGGAGRLFLCLVLDCSKYKRDKPAPQGSNLKLEPYLSNSIIQLSSVLYALVTIVSTQWKFLVTLERTLLESLSKRKQEPVRYDRYYRVINYLILAFLHWLEKANSHLELGPFIPTHFSTHWKNPAYGRQSISRPMLIVALMP